jgi:hypothetical protein
MNIVILDDNDNNYVNQTVRMLKALDLIPEGVTLGQTIDEAQNIINDIISGKIVPDLIVCDLHFGSQAVGTDLARTLKNNNFPTITWSGYPTEEHIAAGHKFFNKKHLPEFLTYIRSQEFKDLQENLKSLRDKGELDTIR